MLPFSAYRRMSLGKSNAKIQPKASQTPSIVPTPLDTESKLSPTACVQPVANSAILHFLRRHDGNSRRNS